MCVDGLLLMMTVVLLRCDRKAIGRNSKSSVIGSMFDIIKFFTGLQEKFGNPQETGKGSHLNLLNYLKGIRYHRYLHWGKVHFRVLFPDSLLLSIWETGFRDKFCSLLQILGDGKLFPIQKFKEILWWWYLLEIPMGAIRTSACMCLTLLWGEESSKRLHRLPV